MQAAGVKVTLVDPGDERRGASFGNAGHIGTEQVEPLASWQTLREAPGNLFAAGGPLDFRLKDLPLWCPWGARFVRAADPKRFAAGRAAMESLLALAVPGWRRILALAGAPALLRENGHWAVWMDEKNVAPSLERWRRAATGTAAFRTLTKEELALIGSAMTKAPAGGLAFTGTGQVSEPQALRSALLASFRVRGGENIAGEVRTIRLGEGKVHADLGDRTLVSDRALVCAGAWSRPLMERLGVKTPLIGERGYSVQSTEYSWPAELPPVFFEETWVVVTRFSSGLRATSFTELGNPSAPPDPRKWERLEGHLRTLGIQFSPQPSRWMGPRPTLPDFLPAIGKLERCPHVLYAFGHQHLGLTLAAATAEAIEAVAFDRLPPADLTPFRIERFQ